MQELIDYLKQKNTTLNEAYDICYKTKSDINEHFSILYKLAKECSHITEFGTRYGVSTTCFLMAKPRYLATYDIHPKETVPYLKQIADHRTNFQFIHESSVETTIQETDLLFIDSYHTYDHLKKELLHAPKVKKYIVIHDTEICGLIGGHKSGAKGLKPAITEFLNEEKSWYKKAHYKNNNGMTVLQRSDIVGDYTDYQLNSLIQVLDMLDDEQTGIFIEIGCWKGKSTATVANKIWPNNLHAVDSWKGNVDEQNITGKTHPTVTEASTKDIFSIFQTNMSSHTKGNVIPHVQDCFEYLEKLENKVKFCHIDASHDYKSVKKTIKMLLPKLTQKAILCGDDFIAANKNRKDLEGGVEKAVQELLPNFKTDRNFWWHNGL